MKDANRAKKQNTSEGKLKTSNRQLRAEITECKQIEEKLKRTLTAISMNRDLFKAIINSTPDWIFVKDRNFRYILVNKPYASAMGKSPEDFVNKDDVEIGFSKELIFGNPDKKIAGLRNDDQKVLNGEIVHNPCDLAISANGVSIPFDTYKTPLKDKDGDTCAILGFAHNINKNKKVEAALKESEEKVQTLYNSSSDAIMLLDKKGFFDCNAATLRLFGYTSKKEFCNKHPGDLSPPIQPDGANSVTYSKKNIAFALKEGSARFEHLHRHSDGTDFPTQVLLDRMMLGGKKVLQARVFDLTENKKAEETTKKRLAELEIFHKVTVGREIKMIELKKEINALCRELNRKEPYL